TPSPGGKYDEPDPEEPDGALVAGEGRKHAPGDQRPGERERYGRHALRDSAFHDARAALAAGADRAFDGFAERVGGHAAPPVDAHEGPRRGGASPSVVVGADDEREIEAVGEMHDTGTFPPRLRQAPR